VKRVAVLGAVLLLASASQAGAKLQLRPAYAERLMQNALSRHAGLFFSEAHQREVHCNKRLSNVRRRCNISWYYGDLYYSGKGQIWVTFESGGAYWNFRYRVVRFNEYCAAVVEGDDCTKVIEVR
jgi:hypothetical protein